MKIMHKMLIIAIAAMFLATQAQAIMFFARPYDPNLQRWITRDPIGERGGLNLYGYVHNNPVNIVDPLGFEGNPISGLGDAWNSNPDGPGGSFYGPGLYYTPPLIPDSGIGNVVNSVAQSLNAALTDQNLWNFLATDTDGASKLGEPFAAALGAGIVKVGEKCMVKEAGIIAQNGVKIGGFTRHGVDRAIGDGLDRRGVSPQAILDALQNPLKIAPVILDNLGRPSQRFIGQFGEVVVNPQTGLIISVNPTSTSKAFKLLSGGN